MLFVKRPSPLNLVVSERSLIMLPRMQISLKTIVCIIIFAAQIWAQDMKPIDLPKPDTVGGKPLMSVLKQRKSTRSFSDQKLTPQVLSNLLWAAFGINRPDGHRTAPSAMNWQEIDLYLVMQEGAYRYNPVSHGLEPVLGKDIRKETGTQAFVADAPLNLVYVADRSKTMRASGEDRDLFTGADCGFIAQNVYLFCASEGLATVVRGSVEKNTLAKSLGLRPDQKIILAQTVGYPGK